MQIEGKPVHVLDHGFVRLVNVLGDDSAITRAARVSYQSEARSAEDDQKLIDYLWRNLHTTPFEMVEFTFHARLPIFVARQWIRHRTANVNEMSGRYTQLPGYFYHPTPERVQGQSKTNKQGSDGVELECANDFIKDLMDWNQKGYDLYDSYIQKGVAKELARMFVANNVYTEWYWKIDLKNLLHFLGLRIDSHAQSEIRVYADEMLKMIEPFVPFAIAAWKKHSLKEG